MTNPKSQPDPPFVQAFDLAESEDSLDDTFPVPSKISSHLHRHRFRQANAHHLLHGSDHARNSHHDSAHFRNHRNFIDAVKGPGTSLVTQVIQTVSLVRLVDNSGHPFATRTIFAPPATILVDPVTGNTVAIPGSNQSAPSAPTAAPGSDPTRSDDDPPPYTTSNMSPSTSRRKPSSSSSSSSSSSTSHLSPNHTSLASNTSSNSTSIPPSTTASAHLTLSGSHNSTATTTHSSGEMTLLSVSGNVFDSVLPSEASSETGSLSSSTRSSESYATRSRSKGYFSRTTTYSAASWSETATATNSYTSDGGLGGSVGGTGQAAPTSDADGGGASDGPGLSFSEKRIVGGVVGGVAGVAFLLLFIMIILKWKRRRDGRALILDEDGGPTSRQITSGPTGGGGGSQGGQGTTGGAREMSKGASAAPVGVTAALAALSAKRKSQPSATDRNSERGFYRVSGRKLPSVLQVGGDGYTDPRGSTMSGQSDYYRGSQAFDPMTAGSTQLALGSPMRPVSGVPIMRSGPGRTLTTEQNPFADPPSSPVASAPPQSPTGSPGRPGRPLTGRTGSRSRFHEGL